MEKEVMEAADEARILRELIRLAIEALAAGQPHRARKILEQAKDL